jgi:hypothetical protein
MNIKYIILEFTPSPFCQSKIVSTGIFFQFTFVCTQHLCHNHPVTHILHFFTLPLSTPIPQQYLFLTFVLQFLKRKEKEMTIFLVYDSHIGNFLVTLLCIYVLIPGLVHFLSFTSFYFSSFLMVVFNQFKCSLCILT